MALRTASGSKGARGVGKLLARSLAYGYAGAVLGGLMVAVVGLPLGLTADASPSVAVPAGLILGLAGLALPWRRRALARLQRR